MELNETKQIEEMAKVIDHTFEIAESIGASRPSSRMIAMDLYDMGCRKLSKNERLGD